MPGIITDWGFGIQLHNAAVTPAYVPSSYFTGGTAGPWYDPNNTANTQNGSSTPATNGQTVVTLIDSGTAGINATQATNGAVLQTGFANGRSALNLATTNYYDCTGLNAFTSGANNLTIPCVFVATDASTNHIMARQYDNPFSNERFRAGFAGDKPRLLFNKDAGSYGNDRIGATGLTTGTTSAAANALIYVFDAQNGLDGIYANNGTYLAFTAAGGTTAASAFDATTANQSRFFLNCLGRILDIYVHKNAIMTAQQRSDWFAAVKARFALTTY